MYNLAHQSYDQTKFIKMKTIPVNKLIILLVVAIIGARPLQVASFWFTDSSLFQVPIQAIIGQQSELTSQQQAPIILQAQDSKQTTDTPAVASTSSSSSITWQLRPPEAAGNELLLKSEPWIKVDQVSS